MQTTLVCSPACRPALRTGQPAGRRMRGGMARAEPQKPLQEFREDTGEVKKSSSSSDQGSQPEAPPKFLYADENPPPPRNTMSPEMRERLRRENAAWGGSPNQSSGNYILYLILAISFLAVLSKLTGAI